MNVVGSTIAREDDGGIYLHAGPEIGVASTKAFTSQVIALALLTLKLGAPARHVGGAGARDRRRRCRRCRSRSRRSSTAPRRSRRSPRSSRTRTNFLYLGRGYNFPVALEGALKLKEISYIHAEGYPAAEMKHGPIALIDEKMPVVFIAPHDSVFDKVVSNVQEVKARGGRVIAITSRDEPVARREARLRVPDSARRSTCSTPVLAAIPLQLLAYYIAVKRGLNVDQPRNLAKSVTVE